MPPHSASRASVHARHPILPLGLPPAELALVERAASGRFALVAPHDVRLAVLSNSARTGVLLVASLRRWTDHQAEGVFASVLTHVRAVLLLPPNTTDGEQRRLSELAPRAEMVILGRSSTTDALRVALDVARHRAVADTLMSRLAEVSELAPVAKRAFCEAVRLLPNERTVAALCRELFLTERTLRRQLKRTTSGLTPREALGWAVLLHAAWNLEARTLSFDRLSAELGASSPANLRRLMRKHTGLTPKSLRSNAVDSVVAALSSKHGRDVPCPVAS